MRRVLLPIAIALWSCSAGGVHAGGYSIFYSFPGGKDGCSPADEDPLLTDGSGNLYGTTVLCGNANAGHGIAFELSSQAKETILYRFKGAHGTLPGSGLIADSAGNLYGTTDSGGFPNAFCKNGCGTVFKLAPDGTETVLHSFEGGDDGARPYAGLTMDGAGNLYGTTFRGGAADLGIIFEVAADGAEKVLHTFEGGATDGSNPEGGLIVDSNGNMYGTATQGGYPAYGIVYELPSGGTFSILYNFMGQWDGDSDGVYPTGVLTMDNAGNMYGTTEGGGTVGLGTVFKLAPDGTETVLHSFVGGLGDGAEPWCGVTLDGAGNIYGTTYIGGVTGEYVSGTIFKVSSSGKEKVLHFFGGNGDGYGPLSPLVWSNGSLYGTTVFGGADGGGTVFKYKP